jgi:hypothetical protein
VDTADALGAAVSQLDSNLPTYFGGTPARVHDEILGVNRITATPSCFVPALFAPPA